MKSQLKTVYRWTRYHAILITLLFVVAIIQQSAVFISLLGLFSFLFLIWQHPTVDSVSGPLPVLRIPANWVTLLRVILIAAVGLTFEYIPPLLLFIFGLLILATDWLDGRLAKIYRTESLFGAQFDQESDAFFISIYALIIYLNGYVGVWVVTLGLLRYLNILALYALNQQHKKEPRFMAARVIAVIVMIALLIPFTTPSTVYVPYLIVAVVSLVFSFGYTFSAQILQPE